MKLFGLLLMATLFLYTEILVGCGEQKEEAESETPVTSGVIKEGTKEPLEQTMDLVRKQKEEYQEQIETKLKEYDQKLGELKSRAKKIKEGAMDEFDQEIEELEKKIRDVYKKLDDLQAEIGEAWENIKSGIDIAMKDLETSFKRTISQYE